MKTDLLFTTKRMKGLWKTLENSKVPLVYKYSATELEDILKQLRLDIENNTYLPSVPYGYLGIPKSSGVTRFVPVISETDLLVYYSLTLALQDFLVEDIPNVFGAYRVVPAKAKKNLPHSNIQKNLPNSIKVVDFDWGYGFGESLARQAWFKNWNQYVEFLEEALDNAPSSYKLITTDIANFYDTINIDKLDDRINRALAKGNADGGFFDTKDLLITFLRFWDRRLGGYQPSSKGIPQEIVGDSSRILANFYLRDFDYKFKEYCDRHNLVYTRWADDIVIFGSSKTKLELAVHKASKFLMKSGLNLNSSKTAIYSQAEFRSYRALDYLKVVDTKNCNKIAKALRKIEKDLYNGKKLRLDTIFTRTLTYVESTKTTNLKILEFIDKYSSDYSIVGGLTSGQLLKLIAVSPKPKEQLDKISKLFLRKPYAGPKSELTLMLWKSRPRLNQLGISDKKLLAVAKRIKDKTQDSEIIRNYCSKKAIRRLESFFSSP